MTLAFFKKLICRLDIGKPGVLLERIVQSLKTFYFVHTKPIGYQKQIEQQLLQPIDSPLSIQKYWKNPAFAREVNLRLLYDCLGMRASDVLAIKHSIRAHPFRQTAKVFVCQKTFPLHLALSFLPRFFYIPSFFEAYLQRSDVEVDHVPSQESNNEKAYASHNLLNILPPTSAQTPSLFNVVFEIDISDRDYVMRTPDAKRVFFDCYTQFEYQSFRSETLPSGQPLLIISLKTVQHESMPIPLPPWIERWVGGRGETVQNEEVTTASLQRNFIYCTESLMRNAPTYNGTVRTKELLHPLDRFRVDVIFSRSPALEEEMKQCADKAAHTLFSKGDLTAYFPFYLDCIPFREFLDPHITYLFISLLEKSQCLVGLPWGPQLILFLLASEEIRSSLPVELYPFHTQCWEQFKEQNNLPLDMTLQAYLAPLTPRTIDTFITDKIEQIVNRNFTLTTTISQLSSPSCSKDFIDTYVEHMCSALLLACTFNSEEEEKPIQEARSTLKTIYSQLPSNDVHEHARLFRHCIDVLDFIDADIFESFLSALRTLSPDTFQESYELLFLVSALDLNKHSHTCRDALHHLTSRPLQDISLKDAQAHLDLLYPKGTHLPRIRSLLESFLSGTDLDKLEHLLADAFTEERCVEILERISQICPTFNPTNKERLEKAFLLFAEKLVLNNSLDGYIYFYLTTSDLQPQLTPRLTLLFIKLLLRFTTEANRPVIQTLVHTLSTHHPSLDPDLFAEEYLLAIRRHFSPSRLTSHTTLQDLLLQLLESI